MDNIDFDIAGLLLLITSVLVTLTSFNIIFSKDLLKNTVLMSVFSLLLAVCYLFMDAPDVTMTESALGACLSTVIILSILKLLKIETYHTVSDRYLHPCAPSCNNILRTILAILLCIIFIITLTYIGIDLPLYGDLNSPVNNGIGKYYLENTQREIGIPSVVAAVLASYRGFDTLGETSVILIAGLSVVLILSEKEENMEESSD